MFVLLDIGIKDMASEHPSHNLNILNKAPTEGAK